MDSILKYDISQMKGYNNTFTFTPILSDLGIIYYVKLYPSSVQNVYQIEFGPLDHSQKEVDTTFRGRNIDNTKIISTVAYIIHIFLRQNPTLLIRFSGSTISRTRLFIIWIVKNHELMLRNFTIYGCKRSNRWERFEIKNRYEAIILRSKVTK
ncbi:MAG: DUF6934 family protein [Bacteroidales bacterium]